MALFRHRVYHNDFIVDKFCALEHMILTHSCKTYAFQKKEKKNQAFDFFPLSISTLVNRFVISVILLASDNPFMKILCNLHLLPLKLCSNHN
jgi:hypothetical protein